MQQHNVARLTRAGTVSTWLTRTLNLTSVGRYFLQRAPRTTFQLGEIGASWYHKSMFFFSADRAHNNQSLLTEAEINRDRNLVRLSQTGTENGTGWDTPRQKLGQTKTHQDRGWYKLRHAGTEIGTGWDKPGQGLGLAERQKQTGTEIGTGWDTPGQGLRQVETRRDRDWNKPGQLCQQAVPTSPEKII